MTCPLCGGPLVPHDDAACERKLAAWRPTGILTHTPQELTMTTDPITPTDPAVTHHPALVVLVAEALDEVALAAVESGPPPASTLREAAIELLDKLDGRRFVIDADRARIAAIIRGAFHGDADLVHFWHAAADTLVAVYGARPEEARPPVVETDRDAVRIVEAVVADCIAGDVQNSAITTIAEEVVRALLGVPTLHRRPDGTLVADWHDTPERTPRAALVARPLLDDIVGAQSREGGDLHVARTAIDVLLDVTAGVREALADPVLGKRHASRLFDSADRILDTLRAIHPYEPPAPVEVPVCGECQGGHTTAEHIRANLAPLTSARTVEDIDRELAWIDTVIEATGSEALAANGRALAEQLRAHRDKLAAAEHDERRPVWPDPEVAVDLIDHTDEHEGDGVIEHLSPDCKVRKCGACVGSAWSVEADALVECTHACHTPVPVVE